MIINRLIVTLIALFILGFRLTAQNTPTLDNDAHKE